MNNNLKDKFLYFCNSENDKNYFSKTLIYLCENNEEGSFGIIINRNISFSVKKKIGNAVCRNKIKRRLRSIMNDAVKKISIKMDYSYLVIPKQNIINSEFIDIKETLFQEFKKIR